MSQPSNSPDLSPFEARLAALQPLPAAVDRDAIMYQAGLTAQRQALRQTLHRWQAMCGVLLAIALGQWVFLPQWDTEEQPMAAQPVRSDTRSEIPAAAPEVLEDSAEPPISTQSEPQSDAVEPTALAGSAARAGLPNERVNSSPRTGRSLAAAEGISVGSSVEALLQEPGLVPRAFSSPRQSPPTVSALQREWAAW